MPKNTTWVHRPRLELTIFKSQVPTTLQPLSHHEYCSFSSFPALLAFSRVAVCYNNRLYCTARHTIPVVCIRPWLGCGLKIILRGQIRDQNSCNRASKSSFVQYHVVCNQLPLINVEQSLYETIISKAPLIDSSVILKSQ